MSFVFPGLAARLRTRRRVLVDRNVLLDTALTGGMWSAWSERALAECADHAELVITPIIYAEVSVGYDSIEAVDAALSRVDYRREPLPWEGGFLAGKCSVHYRRRGGTRISPLPDFYIGAHAAITNLALLTRDASRYNTYFPTVELLSPSRG
jgi:predicted nucleic acid-binding protein